MENKIKIADIVNRNKGIKNHLLLKEYNEKFDTNKEKFYDENKDKEPLKSKIKQLKNFFVIGEYGLGYYRPEGDEVELAKELCQNIIGIDFPTDLYTNTLDKQIDNEKFNKIVENIWYKLKTATLVNNRKLKEDKTLTDDEIKKIIINLPLPSFETEFQKKFNIAKPDLKEINWKSSEYDKYNLKKVLQAEDFVDYLKNKESELEFILKNNIYTNSYSIFNLDPDEIGNLLFKYLENDTLSKFDTAERILLFYYDKLKLATDKFYPGFRFAYRILKLYDKKLSGANNNNNINEFKRLCDCAIKCTKGILDENDNIVPSVKRIFNYVTMFETKNTSQFNLTNEELENIKKDVNNILYFMNKHHLGQCFLDFENGRYGNKQVGQLNLSVNNWDCFCEFCIMFFTYFIALWDGILFDGPLKIEKSAQLRKFVNFLNKEDLFQDISENQEEAKISDGYPTKYCYEETNLFKAFRHLRAILPDEVPKQGDENSKQNNLLN